MWVPSTEEETKGPSKCYFYQSGVLMRKWHPSDLQTDETWRDVTQFIVPTIYQPYVLSLAHDLPMAGYSGVSETYTSILNNLFRPGLRIDVRAYC